MGGSEGADGTGLGAGGGHGGGARDGEDGNRFGGSRKLLSGTLLWR